jgi:hypothetical protein
MVAGAEAANTAQYAKYVYRFVGGVVVNVTAQVPATPIDAPKKHKYSEKSLEALPSVRTSSEDT